ncbi:MAG TPA: ImcF-related family protein [Bryobacteraceae bacterium]|nr:ImcF-related family protein [Bryobacteraceae bacterium]
MNPMTTYLIMAVMTAVFFGVTYLITNLLHLSGPALTIVWTLMAGLVAAGVAGFYNWRNKRAMARAQGGGEGAGAGVEKEIEVFIRDAETRLAQSALGKEAKLAQLPVFFLIGENASAKTSIFVHSGVEPDLLAGQVYQDNTIIPTRPVNFWLARKSVFVEAGGQILADAGRWSTLIRKLNPKRRNPFGGRPQPPRAAVVFLDGEVFLKTNADDALALTARNLRTRLGEISQALGIRLPVYVVFSKLDRLGHFTDFVANLTDEEVMQVFGVTLPLHGDREQGGVYAEEESRRLTAAFDGLFRALCDKRLVFLAREHDPAKLPAVYEFPREFRKLRNSVVRFLVDLGRPSQLRANPFLRGFYFSGVRPVVVKEGAPVARPSAAPGYKRAATGFFGTPSLAAADDPMGEPARARRVPQWLFLGHLFSDVVLRDRAALGASGQSLRTETMRRALAVSLSALFLLWSLALTVSFFRNRALEQRVSEAVHNLSRESGGAAQELPSLDSLERLDALRDTVQQLSIWEREGAPWSLRWGLYAGHDLYPSARRLYFAAFYHLLFGNTQLALLDWLRKLPEKPGPNDQYKPTYDDLKAYLITTSHHEKTTRDFLPPILMEKWSAARNVDTARADLARRQFEFYSDELFLANPFSSDNDGGAVEHARSYLAQFNAIESIYQFIIADASHKNPPLNFNKKFPGSARYVVNDKNVAGAFTAEGWKFVDNAINNVKLYFGGEAWVLGDHNYGSLDPAQIVPLLRQRYQKDFIANWREYLANSQIAPYRSIADAAEKLKQLSSNDSYLLGLFCLASANIEPGSADVKAPYQPVQFVTPVNCADRYVQASNSQYITALAALQTSMDRVAKAGGEVKDDLVAQTQSDATSGYRAVAQIAQNFRPDRDGHVDSMVQKLMEDPIRQAEAILGRLGPAQLNSEGRRVCGDFFALMKKYPFDTSSTNDATLQDVNQIFRPGDGRLAQFYQTNLKNYVTQQGGEYVRAPGSRVQVTDAFLRFFNRAMAFSNALYKNGSRDPSITYAMRALPLEVLKGVTLNLDGQVLKADAKGSQFQDFTWPGAATHGAHLAGNLNGAELAFIDKDGLWAVFRFFGDADRFQPSGSTYTLQWVSRQGQAGQPIRMDGKILAIPFSLDLKGAPPVFQKGYLSGFNCVADVAR